MENKKKLWKSFKKEPENLCSHWNSVRNQSSAFLQLVKPGNKRRMFMKELKSGAVSTLTGRRDKDVLSRFFFQQQNFGMKEVQLSCLSEEEPELQLMIQESSAPLSVE